MRVNERNCDACGDPAERVVVVQGRTGQEKRKRYACRTCYQRVLTNGNFWETKNARKAKRAKEAIRASEMFANGKSFLQIAKALDLSVSTVKNRLS